MGFSRQEYWSGLPFPSPGDLPDPGIELRSPALQADSLHPSHQGGSSCRVRGQKSKFSYRHAELGAVKVKEKKTRNVQACSLFSLFSLCSGKEKKKLIPFFFFLFTVAHAVLRTLRGETWEREGPRKNLGEFDGNSVVCVVVGEVNVNWVCWKVCIFPFRFSE